MHFYPVIYCNIDNLARLCCNSQTALVEVTRWTHALFTFTKHPGLTAVFSSVSNHKALDRYTTSSRSRWSSSAPQRSLLRPPLSSPPRALCRLAVPAQSVQQTHLAARHTETAELVHTALVAATPSRPSISNPACLHRPASLATLQWTA